jgi:hypothetical protein
MSDDESPETERPDPEGPERAFHIAVDLLYTPGSYAERMTVVMNLARAVALDRAHHSSNPEHIFQRLCLDVSLKIAEMPYRLTDHECPGCSKCRPKGFN